MNFESAVCGVPLRTLSNCDKIIAFPQASFNYSAVNFV